MHNTNSRAYSGTSTATNDKQGIFHATCINADLPYHCKDYSTADSSRCSHCAIAFTLTFHLPGTCSPNKGFHISQSCRSLLHLRNHMAFGGGAGSFMFRTPTKNLEPRPIDQEDLKALPDYGASHRQQGLPLECGLLERPRNTTAMTTTSATMTASGLAASVMLRQPREPLTFSASPCKDPESWLETYDRVAAFNYWVCNEIRCHVYLFLEGSARTQFENGESTLTIWDLFCTAFLHAFMSVVCKEKAFLMRE